MSLSLHDQHLFSTLLICFFVQIVNEYCNNNIKLVTPGSYSLLANNIVNIRQKIFNEEIYYL